MYHDSYWECWHKEDPSADLVRAYSVMEESGENVKDFNNVQ